MGGKGGRGLYGERKERDCSGERKKGEGEFGCGYIHFLQLSYIVLLKLPQLIFLILFIFMN